MLWLSRLGVFGFTALEIVGENSIALVRAINGATNPEQAEKGTIRYRYGHGGPANAVHGSANSVDAERELSLIFAERF